MSFFGVDPPFFFGGRRFPCRDCPVRGEFVIIIRNHSACSVLNITGDKVAEFRDGYTRVSNYSEDVALVKHKKDMTYNRDSPDEIYYIDKTGKRLF